MAVYKKADRTVEYAEGVEGGHGTMIRDRCNLSDKLGGVCSYVVCNSLVPGASIGEHTHTGETEIYYMVSGKAVLVENGTETVVEAGDVLFCPDGGTHAVRNDFDETTSFVVIIQKTA
jgi:quercetin dioxygenase-like cupin family protein